MTNDDLIARLRELERDLLPFAHKTVGSIRIDLDEVRAIVEAADAIEKLEADNARLREAMKGPLAWLERWAVHVGNCKGDSACTCGLTFVQHELRAALQETSHD